MLNEQIRETWWKHLNDMFDPLLLVIEDLPYLFRDPNCATCFHWFLMNEDGLDHLANTSPKEYQEVLTDLRGERIYHIREKDQMDDVYRSHRFYGWCKRFPPLFQHRGYSVIGFRSLFTFLSRHVPKKISEYDFPLMPFDSSCGEWKESPWVEDFVTKHKEKPISEVT
jgi:hypothetical protein